MICERGFGETRIADVAKRADASSALVIYYFGPRERLLVDALRYSEQNFYDAAEKMLAEVPSVRERRSLLIRWTCVPENDGDLPGARGRRGHRVPDRDVVRRARTRVAAGPEAPHRRHHPLRHAV